MFETGIIDNNSNNNNQNNNNNKKDLQSDIDDKNRNAIFG